MTDAEIQKTDAWLAYREQRHEKRKRSPFTEKAQERILKKLQALESQGQSIEEMLWQSVECGWTGIFPCKTVSSKPTIVGSLTVASVEFEKTQRYLAEQKAEVVSAERNAEIAQRLKEARARVEAVRQANRVRLMTRRVTA